MDSKTARKIGSKNTSIELLLRRELFRLGFRYIIHDKRVFGKPDIVFFSKKIAIFCDSSFWHGKKYLAGEKFKTNREFWEKKITDNIRRDRLVNATLTAEGWTVLRFWDSDIKNNISGCIDQISAAITAFKANGPEIRKKQ